MSFDPRLTPARADLAASHLRGEVEAGRYVDPTPACVAAASVPLRRRPEATASWDTEALFGEEVAVYDDREGWAFVQLLRDGYVGYLESAALGQAEAATHSVVAVRTHAYPGPSMKLPAAYALSMGARARIVARSGNFLVDAAGRHFWATHLAASDATAPDFVSVAERFEHCPYLWGGRTSEGIDCSGLVQTALRTAGIAAPRDSDMQEALGSALAADAPLRRGDLVFWKGHVGVMRNDSTLLHANGHHMAVVSEPLAEARARIAASGDGEITSIRRL